jgi:glycosyltransferase involved in cell wall biosynthesis
VRVAIVHDYLTQRGGAERVVATMLRAFPSAPVYTSLYYPDETFRDFGAADVRTGGLNRIALLRRNHRLALPLLASVFSRLEVEADVVICSSSGWAHGTRVRGRKVVYCYAPARWLYQRQTYLGERNWPARISLAALRASLIRWDRRTAHTADLYLTSSTAIQEQIRQVYGIEAELVPPPHSINVEALQQPVKGLGSGFFLCVSRLLPYKNVGAVIEAFAGLRDEQLVVVGTGPEERRLAALAGTNVRLLGSVSDAQLRWLYANCSAVVAASREDYGLTPLEGAAFGKPSAVLRWGGFLDTVVEGVTGVFFDAPTPGAIRQALGEVRAASWDDDEIRVHAGRYSEGEFIKRLRSIVRGERRALTDPVPV